MSVSIFEKFLPPPPKIPRTICKAHGNVLESHCQSPTCTWAMAKSCKRTWEYAPSEKRWHKDMPW